VSEHDEYCDTHFDQYPWECTCGATYRQQRDTIEAQAAEIERLKVECQAQYHRGYYDGRTALGETK
jgi:hypothetical protein